MAVQAVPLRCKGSAFANTVTHETRICVRTPELCQPGVSTTVTATRRQHWRKLAYQDLMRAKNLKRSSWKVRLSVRLLCGCIEGNLYSLVLHNRDPYDSCSFADLAKQLGIDPSRISVTGIQPVAV